MVGIVIGILVVLVLAILLWYCLYYKRRNNKQGSHVVQNMPLTENFKSIKVPSKFYDNFINESKSSRPLETLNGPRDVN